MEFYEQRRKMNCSMSLDEILFMEEHYKVEKNVTLRSVWSEKHGDLLYATSKAKAAECYARCLPEKLSADKQLLVAESYFRIEEYVHGLKWYEAWYASACQPAYLFLDRNAEEKRSIVHKVADCLWNKSMPDKAIEWYEKCFAMVDVSAAQKQIAARGQRAPAQIAPVIYDAPEIARKIADYYYEQKAWGRASRWYEKLDTYAGAVRRNTGLLQRIVACYQAQKDAVAEARWSERYGERLQAEGDDRAAVQAYIVCKDAITDPQKQRLLTYYYLEQNDVLQARKWCDKYVENSRDVAMWRKIGDLFRDKQRWDDAIPYYENYLKYHSSWDTEVSLQLAHCQYLSGKTSQALERLALVGWKDCLHPTKNPPSGEHTILENEGVLIVNGKFMFLKYDNRFFSLPPNMVSAYEVAPATLFHRGGATLVLKAGKAPQELPNRFVVSENLKKDAELHAMVKNILTSGRVPIRNV